VLSSDAETACRPSGVTAHAHTALAWPWSVATWRPLASSHTLNVWSSDAETTCRPSGVTAHAVTDEEWPETLRTSAGLSRGTSWPFVPRRPRRRARRSRDTWPPGRSRPQPRATRQSTRPPRHDAAARGAAHIAVLQRPPALARWRAAAPARGDAPRARRS